MRNKQKESLPVIVLFYQRLTLIGTCRFSAVPFLLSAFAKLRNRLLALPCLSVCLSVCPLGTTRLQLGRIFMKFDVRLYFGNLSR